MRRLGRQLSSQPLSVGSLSRLQKLSSPVGTMLSQPPIETQFARGAKITTIDKGIRVATIDFISPIVSLNWLIATGSVHERKTANGVAHFLEHMHFKGTNIFTEKNLFRNVEERGGHLNAFTSRDYTIFFLNIPREHLPWGIEALSNIFAHSTFLPDLIERERGVILSEREHCFNDVIDSLLEMSHETSFPTHSIGRPLLGHVENIQSITRKDLLDFKETNYTGDRMIFAASGLENHDKLSELVMQKFVPHVRKSFNSKEPELISNLKKPEFSGNIKMYNGPEGSVRIGLYFNGPSWSEDGYEEVMLLTRVLGVYEKPQFVVDSLEDTSLIFKLAHKHHFVERIEFMFSSYENSGLIGLFLEGDEDYADELYSFGCNMLKDLPRFINEEIVIQAQTKLVGELMILETATEMTQDLAVGLRYLDRYISKSEFIHRFMNLKDPALLIDTLNKFIIGKPMSITVVGPEKSTDKLTHHLSHVKTS